MKKKKKKINKPVGLGNQVQYDNNELEKESLKIQYYGRTNERSKICY